MPNLVYSIAPYVPFTKILSSSANQDKTDIQNRINWAGGTNTATGLGDSNIQGVAASGGGLTRATKLKAGTANYVVINDSSGIMSEEAQLDSSRGGTGLNIVPGSFNPGDVIQINSTATALTIAPTTSTPSTLKIFQFYHFS